MNDLRMGRSQSPRPWPRLGGSRAHVRPAGAVAAVLALGLAAAGGGRIALGALGTLAESGASRGDHADAGDAAAGRAGTPAPAAARGGADARAQLVKPPTKAALTMVELVRARSMGVDHAGNLWAWDPIEGSVRFFSPAAERAGTVVVTKAAESVEGDAEWGVLMLADEGTRLTWVRPSAEIPDAIAESAVPAPPPAAPSPPAASSPSTTPTSGATPAAAPAAPGGAAAAKPDEIQLPQAAGWACWINADTVAVAPQLSGHRVELWSLRQRKLLKTFGKEQPIVLQKGANRVRQVQLRWDGARGLLYTLESFTGDLQVFKLDGSLVWRAKAENPFRKVEEGRLAELDAKAKSYNTSYPQTFPDLWLAEGPDGSAWVREGVDILHNSVTLLRSTSAGAAPHQVENLRCAGRTFTIWGDNLIFYRDIAVPREVCNTIAPLP